LRIIYECDLCGNHFDSWGECMYCEDTHVKPLIPMDCSGYIEWRQSGTQYPSIINVPMNNGHTMQYELVGQLPK
jgi:hypothetical protein